MGAPKRGDSVGERQLEVRVGRHVGDRKIVGDEGVGEGGVGDGDEEKLRARSGPSNSETTFGPRLRR